MIKCRRAKSAFGDNEQTQNQSTYKYTAFETNLNCIVVFLSLFFRKRERQREREKDRQKI